MAENELPTPFLSLKGQYIKDLSFENPRAPQSLLALSEAPGIDVNVDLAAQRLQDNLFELGMHISARASHEKQTLFNPDMVLFFLGEVLSERSLPNDMVDHNVRIDYTKLRHLIIAGERLNGNFRCLQELVERGFCHANLVTSFPLAQLTQEQNFISLLYYLGLLTIRGYEEGALRLEIPNQTIETLIYGYLRAALKDSGVFEVSQSNLISNL